MSRLPDRSCPSGPGAARPASRAAARDAVRPRAFSSSTWRGRPSQLCLCLPARAGSGIDGRGYAGVDHSQARLCCSAPRPAPAVAQARQPLLFLSLSPRPVRYRLGWLASARRAFGPGGVGTGTLLGTALGTPKPLKCFSLRQSSHCSHPPPAHVIRSRAHAHRILSLSLGTWEQRDISYTVQGVGAFLRPFPGRAALGTWEQAKRRRSSPDRLSGAWNKIEGGYADLRWFAGDARGKFRGSIAPMAAGADVDQGARGGLGLVAAQLDGNGGFAPFSGRRIGHVGRLDVGRVAKGVRGQGLSCAEQKLCRLTGLRLAELGAVQLGAIGAALGGLEAGRPAEAAPGPPIADPRRACTLALTFGRISIERPFRPESVQQSGLISDRLASAGPQRAQIWRLAKGAGGNSRAPKRSLRAPARPISVLGIRAGVISLPAGKQAPIGGLWTLGPAFVRVNSGWGAAA